MLQMWCCFYHNGIGGGMRTGSQSTIFKFVWHLGYSGVILAASVVYQLYVVCVVNKPVCSGGHISCCVTFSCTVGSHDQQIWCINSNL